jgi:hypothetical protein
LPQFQAKQADAEGTFELVTSLNNVLSEGARTHEQLRRSFDHFWPDLEKQILELPDEAPLATTRGTPEMVEEILNLVRGFARDQSVKSSDLAGPHWMQLRRHMRDENIPMKYCREIFMLVANLAQESGMSWEISEGAVLPFFIDRREAEEVSAQGVSTESERKFDDLFDEDRA